MDESQRVGDLLDGLLDVVGAVGNQRNTAWFLMYAAYHNGYIDGLDKGIDIARNPCREQDCEEDA